MLIIIGIILFVASAISGGIIGYKLSSYSSRNLYHAAKINELINRSNRGEL